MALGNNYSLLVTTNLLFSVVVALLLFHPGLLVPPSFEHKLLLAGLAGGQSPLLELALEAILPKSIASLTRKHWYIQCSQSTFILYATTDFAHHAEPESIGKGTH